jgi:hypothetical protein
MEITKAILIRSRARDLLASCWHRRVEFWRGRVQELDEFLLFAPDKIATGILGLKVIQVDGISAPSILAGEKPSVEIVGEMNRHSKVIRYVPKYGFVQGRFTLAHEIAHYVLHPGMVLHREMPLIHERHQSQLSQEELEANLFGAELLMPGRCVREQFMARFAGIVDGRRRDESLFYWMSQQAPKLDKNQFFAVDAMYRARYVAKAQYVYGRSIISLCDFFRVSATAMAIQLINLGLVK